MQEFAILPAHAIVFSVMQRRAFFYPLVEVAKVLGIAPKTAYNLATAGKFPVKNKRLGGKRVVALEDLAGVLSGEPSPVTMPPSPLAAPGPTKRGRGRPPKSEQIAGIRKGEKPRQRRADQSAGRG